MMKWMLPAIAASAFALPMAPAHATGPYDGTWVFQAPAVAGGGGDYDREECNAVRFEAQIVDNKVVGNLRRAQYPQSGTNVESTPGRGATPIQGSVTPDGNLTANWQKYKAAGHLSGDKGDLSWKGQCGTRVATATRTARPATAGTTVPPTKEHQIYFGVNQASLTPAAEKTIQQLADSVKLNPNLQLVVTGKADRSGDASHNMQLSQQRAEAVSQALVKAGVPADHIQAQGVGESDLPVPTGDNVKEPKNRVVDVLVH